MRARDVSDYCKTTYMEIESLSDRHNHILSSSTARRYAENQKPLVPKIMKKHEIIDELNERRIAFKQGQRKEELVELLEREYHGIRKVPAVLQFKVDSKENIDNYKVLPCEPLHAV